MFSSEACSVKQEQTRKLALKKRGERVDSTLQVKL